MWHFQLVLKDANIVFYRTIRIDIEELKAVFGSIVSIWENIFG